MSSWVRYRAACLLIVVAGVMSSGAGAWTLERNFNSGAQGKQVTKIDGLDAAQGRTVYSSEHVYEGASAAKLTIYKGETGWGNWGGYITHPKALRAGDELWFRVRTFFPFGFDYFSYSAGNRLKVLRVHTAHGSTGAHEGYNDILIDMKSSPSAFKFGFEGQNWWADIGNKSALPKFDEWETYEFYIKFHPVPLSKGGEAVVRFWKNGKLLKEITDRKTLVSMKSVATRSLLFTYWNGGAPKTQSMWVDDIVLTSETPASKDEFGNPFVGVGGPGSLPMPPVLRVSEE